MPENVLAVVVTYNRVDLLKRCVKYVQEQTVRPHLLIINNQSTDGTEQYLLENNIDHITQPNGGSSAGWWRGISESQQRGYSYAWLMDDDGFPDSLALELLLNKMDNSTACVSSAIVKENVRNEFVFGIPRLNKFGNPILFSWKRKFSSFDELPSGTTEYPFVHLFNGALINLTHASEIGNVNTEYFLYGDEVDYFCRLRKSGKVYCVMAALHFHPDVNQRKIDSNRVYYFIRNTIILNKKYFDQATLRSVFTVVIAWIRLFQRNGLTTSLTYLIGPNTKYFYYGILDGIKNNFIKRF